MAIKLWTAEEDGIICDAYRGIECVADSYRAQVASRLREAIPHRSESAIKNRAQRLGVRPPRTK